LLSTPHPRRAIPKKNAPPPTETARTILTAYGQVKIARLTGIALK